MTIKWESITAQDLNLISLILDRAKSISTGTGSTLDHASKVDLMLDMTAYHIANPLKLDDLLKAPDFDLLHDVHGIHCHINRETGKPEGFFYPRYAEEPSEADRLGEWLVDLLGLKKNKEGRYLTDAGPKTLRGLGECVIDHVEKVRAYENQD